MLLHPQLVDSAAAASSLADTIPTTLPCSSTIIHQRAAGIAPRSNQTVIPKRSEQSRQEFIGFIILVGM
jgi:hypothetical protein